MIKREIHFIAIDHEEKVGLNFVKMYCFVKEVDRLLLDFSTMKILTVHVRK